MILEKAILQIYPDAVPNVDFYVVDDGDGKGPEIKNWEYSGTIPTYEQLQSAWLEYQNAPKPPLLDERIKQLEDAVNFILLGGM